MGSGSPRAIAKTKSGGAIDRADLPRPDLTPEDIAVFCNLLGVGPRYLSRAREAITARYDLGPRGAWIIGMIEVGVDSPSALTEALCIGRSLATAEINRLLQAGLVAGNQSASDGRRVVLELTDEGRQVSAELRDTVNEFVSSRLAGYSRKQVLEAIKLLQDFVGGTQIGSPRG